MDVSWRNVYSNIKAIQAIALIIVHQGVIASSAYFLTGLIESVQNGGDVQFYLSLYLASMIVPFIPGCLSLIIMQHWINRVHRDAVRYIAKAAFARPAIYRDKDKREAFESILSRNSFGVISNYIALAHDFVSLFLNSLFSIMVIGFLLPGGLVAGYLISFVLAMIIILFIKIPVKKRSLECEENLVKYGNGLAGGWGNTTLGNHYNYDRWTSKTQALGDIYYTSSNRLVGVKQLGNLSVALVSLLPTAFLLYQMISAKNHSPELIAAVVVNLTRIFHILNALSTLIYQMLEWSSIHARFHFLLGLGKQLQFGGGLPKGPVGKVTINGEIIAEYNSAVETIAEEGRGRFTVRGDNGSGKSTLLLMMKEQFSVSAMFLPSNDSLLSWGSDHERVSTGERMCAVLEEVSNVKGIKYLLLDEWDANLDQDNKNRLDAILDSISAERVVVEVRH
ncbi:MAG: hypothetical protein WED00_07045 [Aquisalimonadaceae bacterium]